MKVCFVGSVNLALPFFLILRQTARIENPILKLSVLILILLVNYLKFLKQNLLKLNICISFYQMIYIICLWVPLCASARIPLCPLMSSGGEELEYNLLLSLLLTKTKINKYSL